MQPQQAVHNADKCEYQKTGWKYAKGPEGNIESREVSIAESSELKSGKVAEKYLKPFPVLRPRGDPPKTLKPAAFKEHFKGILADLLNRMEDCEEFRL